MRSKIARNKSILLVACLSNQHDSLSDLCRSGYPQSNVVIVRNLKFSKRRFLVMRLMSYPISIVTFMSFKDKCFFKQSSNISLIDEKRSIFFDLRIEIHFLVEINFAPHLIIERISSVPS